MNAAHRLQVTSPVTLANVGARGAQAVGSEAATTPTMLGRVVDSEPPRHPGPRPRSQVVAPPQNHRPGGARLLAAREDSDAVQARRGEHPPDRRQAQPPVLPSANGLRGNLANCIQRSTRPAGERGAAEEKARGRQLPGPSHAQPAAVPRPMHRAQATRSRPQAALNGNQQARARWSNANVSGQYEAGVPPPARCKGCGQARVLGFMQAHTRCADDRRDSASPTNPLDVVAPGSCAPLDCQAVLPGQSPACMTKHVSAPVPGLGPATVSCTTSWLSVDGDKSRAELLCAFTGARDEGVALLITALQALGLSGRIRCPAASTSQFTLDDMGLQRHVAVHKVFTCNESIKPAFWREDKVGQQDIGGLTVFRSGYAAVQAERVQRQRWARALIRHGYKSKRALTAMNTSGVAWSDAWEHLRELGIKPECTVKGVHCAPVEDSSMAEYWAIWAFNEPPPVEHEAQFMKLSPDEAKLLAVKRWGVNGIDGSPRQVPTAIPRDGWKRHTPCHTEARQPARSAGDAALLLTMENRLATLEEALARRGISPGSATMLELTAMGESMQLLQAKTAVMEAAQVANSEAVRTFLEKGVAERASTVLLVRDALTSIQQNMMSAMAVQAKQHNEEIMREFGLNMAAALARQHLTRPSG